MTDTLFLLWLAYGAAYMGVWCVLWALWALLKWTVRGLRGVSGRRLQRVPGR